MILLDCIASIFLLLSAITAHQLQNRTWIYAIISCVAYFIIFMNNHLYADAILQAFYIIFSILGFSMWFKNPLHQTEPISKDKEKLKKFYVIYFEFAFIAIPIIGYLLSKTNDPMPYIDSLLFVFSIIATVMLMMKDKNSWLMWMFIDVVYIFVFAQRNLHSSTLIYFILSINAFYGYYKWDTMKKV